MYKRQPLGPQAFFEKRQPIINQEVNTHAEKFQEDNYEVTLTITLTAKLEEQTVFVVEIDQAGLFFIKGLTDDQLPQLLHVGCPSILLPYAREAIDSALVRGTLSPLMLSPINFDALYAQAIEQRQQEQQ